MHHNEGAILQTSTHTRNLTQQTHPQTPICAGAMALKFAPRHARQNKLAELASSGRVETRPVISEEAPAASQRNGATVTGYRRHTAASVLPQKRVTSK